VKASRPSRPLTRIGLLFTYAFSAIAIPVLSTPEQETQTNLPSIITGELGRIRLKKNEGKTKRKTKEDGKKKWSVTQ
jgi:hypothetical protein